MCRVLRVSRSGYYAWETRPQSEHARRDEELLELIKRVFEASERLYGAPRVHAELRLKHHQRVAKKRPAPAAAPHPDRLQRDFNVSQPDRVWLADITQHRTSEGWLYLAVVTPATAW